MTIFKRITLGVIWLLGLVLVLWGLATVFFFPQPEHVPALAGTALGVLRDAPNLAVGISMISCGGLLIYLAIIFRHVDEKVEKPFGQPWGINAWRGQGGGSHTRIIH